MFINFLNLIAIPVIMYFSVFCHELAHFSIAKLLKLPVSGFKVYKNEDFPFIYGRTHFRRNSEAPLNHYLLVVFMGPMTNLIIASFGWRGFLSNNTDFYFIYLCFVLVNIHALIFGCKSDFKIMKDLFYKYIDG
jgi:hypothetical protein